MEILKPEKNRKIFLSSVSVMWICRFSDQRERERENRSLSSLCEYVDSVQVILKYQKEVLKCVQQTEGREGGREGARALKMSKRSAEACAAKRVEQQPVLLQYEVLQSVAFAHLNLYKDKQ